MKERYIKNVNRKYLIGYMLLNLALFSYQTKLFYFDINNLNNLLQKLLDPTHILGILIIPLSLILEGIMNTDLKHRLVFCRFKNAVPGSRAFSEIGPKDSRIDMSKIEILFGSKIPKDPIEQNNTWFRFYKKHSNKPIVYESHRSFLLTRDIASLTFIFVPTILVAYLLCGSDLKAILVHIGILAMILILTIIACQNYGKRFVANVLVEEINSITENEFQQS